MSYSDDVNIAVRKCAQELCDHRFIPDTGYGYICRYCHLQVIPLNNNGTGIKCSTCGQYYHFADRHYCYEKPIHESSNKLLKAEPIIPNMGSASNLAPTYEQVVSNTLEQVDLWNRGRISKERLSELLGINFYELDRLLATNSAYNLLWFVMPYLQDMLWESHNSEDQLKAIMEMVTDLFKQLKAKSKAMEATNDKDR